MKVALVITLALTGILLVGCGSSDTPSGPTPAFGSKAAPPSAAVGGGNSSQPAGAPGANAANDGG